MICHKNQKDLESKNLIKTKIICNLLINQFSILYSQFT
jgi:hypothetical protein